MRNWYKILLFLLCVCCCNWCFAQDDADPCEQHPSKTAEKMYKKAREFQKSGKKSEAVEIYEELLAENPDYLEAQYYYAVSFYLPLEMNHFELDTKVKKQNAEKALAAFNAIYNICPYYKIHYNMYAARLSYIMERFSEAKKFAQVLLDNPDLVSKLEYLDEAKIIIDKSSFYDHILSNPVPFEPRPVKGISTKDDEYLATVSPDGECFYFTRRMDVVDNSPFGQGHKVNKEFFSYSKKRSDGSFGKGEPLPTPFNVSTNEGSPTINLSNDMLIFSRMTPARIGGGNYPNYDLYCSYYIDGEWTTPEKLGGGINRDDSWESQPSLSSDGEMLFFASDRPGGFGGSDIWCSRKNAAGEWQKPTNLGQTINTAGNERSPFLHTDSKTLYFSSSGHDGMGGMDVFYAKIDDKGRWSKPINIGHPINTERDEVDFFVSLDGKTGYFSSDHYTAQGELVGELYANETSPTSWDIFQFELYEAARPKSMIIIKGKVEADDGEIENAVVEVRNSESKVISKAKVNANTGQYAIAAEVNKEKPENLIVNVKKEGHSFDTKMITVEQQSQPVITNDAEVKKVEVGKVCDLHDINFSTNDFSLDDNSKRIIDLFIEFLNENPTVKVEIQGHTDNIGDDKSNQKLSEERAKSVYDYVLSQNVDSNRLKYKGYGESKPIADNNTAAGRAKNRRTVFVILAK
ncbi:MAG: OmpA family protein [Bacteroidales bacterium]|nr:OmpA family protein [Bacteroidales bacterium]